MIQDFPASERPAWRLIGSEILAFTAAGLFYPFGLKRARRRTPRKEEQRTVVLIHGYLANRSTFLLLKAYLHIRGGRQTPQILSFDYRSSEGIERGARELKNYLRKHVRGGKIDLVCHSIGGLVARVYLQELDGARRVERCITLGTPHRGTYAAYWITSRIGRELRPDSQLLRRLKASSAKASRVSFTSIVAGSDNFIIPRVFCSNEETVHVPDLGHMGMLFSPTALRVVAERLERPGDRKANPALS